ncbi:MAG TPA: Lin0512 family protein [Methylomirabilota bacterium]|nr:Lin0512 family protein [Methylomirabilota bacterium]
MSAKPVVLEFGMGVDVHGADSTTAACRAVSDAIRHSSLPLFQEVRERGGRMLVDVTVGVPDPASVDVDRVRRELPHGEVTVRPVSGGLRVPGADTLIACVAITVSVEYPQEPRR